MDALLLESTTLAKKVALFAAKSTLEPMLISNGLVWSLPSPPSRCIQVIYVPQHRYYSQSILTVDALSPFRKDVVSVIDAITITDLQDLVKKPLAQTPTFFDKIIASSLPLTKKKVLFGWKSTLEPKIKSAGFTWDEALTTVDMVSKVCSLPLTILLSQRGSNTSRGLNTSKFEPVIPQNSSWFHF